MPKTNYKIARCQFCQNINEMALLRNSEVQEVKEAFLEAAREGNLIEVVEKGFKAVFCFDSCRGSVAWVA
jgi:hypothetical protein